MKYNLAIVKTDFSNMDINASFLYENKGLWKADLLIKTLTKRHSLLSDLIVQRLPQIEIRSIKGKVSNILLIDDDPILNFLTGKILNKVDEKVKLHCYNSPMEALEALQNGILPTPDMIFLDINMPELNGWEFLHNFKSLKISSKVIIFTSSIDPADIERAESYPEIWDYVIKPLDEQKLSKLIQRF